MSNSALMIWIGCLTVLFAITQLGDLRRWEQFGSRLHALEMAK